MLHQLYHERTTFADCQQEHPPPTPQELFCFQFFVPTGGGGVECRETLQECQDLRALFIANAEIERITGCFSVVL
jgi:hypothetical protein